MENSSNQTKRSTTSGYIYPKYKQYRDSLAKKLREDWQNPKLNNIDITKFSPSQIERLKSQCRREILESVQQTEEYQQARTAKNAARKNELEELVESLVDSTGMTAKAARYVVYGKKETPTTTPEKMGTLEQQMVNHILATNGNRVNQLKTTGFLDIEGGDKIQTHLTKAEKDQLRPLAQSDITEVTPVEKTYQGEQYHIITCKIRGEQYTAIQVPNKLKTMKYQNTHIGQQLMLFKGRHFYPAFLTDEKLANPLDQDRLIRKTEPAMQADGTPHTNIKLYTDGNQEWDIVRECAKKGMRMQTITDYVIMAELIKGRFGKDYLWEEFTEGNFWKIKTEASYKDFRTKVKKIEDEFWVKYVINTKNYRGYLNREYSMYKPEKPRNRTTSDGSKVEEYFFWFFRGYFIPSGAALGGLASVRLGYDLSRSNSDLGFRPSV